LTPQSAAHFIVPYAAGGYTDLVGRMTAHYVESALGKTVVVEGGIVGTQAVANAAPDGYTFCVCSIGAVSIAPFAQKVGYDPIEDLAPIGIVSSIAQAVIVNKDLPVKTMRELVSYGKANPGKLNYGSSVAVTSLERSAYFPALPSVHESVFPNFIAESWNEIIGVGGLTHYSVELFLARTGTTAVHIPFKGGAPSTAAVVSGEVDFAFANMTEALPQIEAGAVRGGPRHDWKTHTALC
jgi:tripartite-type tricarboxylate transporter receptor subunit TctC